MRASLAQLAASPSLLRTRGVMRELAPVWWAARAYLAAGVLALVLRRPVVERDGDRALSAFPIRHFEPGTRRVARPNAGPDIDPGPLRTRPLARR